MLGDRGQTSDGFCDELPVRGAVGAWLRRQGINQDGYYFFDKIIGALSSTPIDRLSLLHVLWWIRRGSGPLRTLWTTFERNLPAGAQAVAQALADRVADDLLLGSAVTAIKQRNGAVEITSASGARVRALRAIVTVPPSVLDRISFDPPLPPELADLNQLRIDPGTKVIAHIPGDKIPRHRLFIGGEILAGGWRVGTRLTGFVPPPADQASDDALFADLANGFGLQPGQLHTSTIYRWSEHPYLPGCDVGFAPGQLTRHGPQLRRSHGVVHFAGAERSSWPNNMEGAVESGSQVAQRIIDQLPR
jgi:monoamine oxidase